MGGTFNEVIDGITFQNLAKFDAIDQKWMKIQAIGDENSAVTALAMAGDTLYVGGTFQFMDGEFAVQNLVGIDTNGNFSDYANGGAAVSISNMVFQPNTGLLFFTGQPGLYSYSTQHQTFDRMNAFLALNLCLMYPQQPPHPTPPSDSNLEIGLAIGIIIAAACIAVITASIFAFRRWKSRGSFKYMVIPDYSQQSSMSNISGMNIKLFILI
jgi:hypothetical protein